VEEKARLSSVLVSHVDVRATREILLLEADDRDHECRLALRKALVTGAVRSVPFAIEGDILLRSLDRALSLVPFIIRSEIDTHFVPSDVTERLVAVAQGVRALRARCKLSRWPRADVEQVHSEMQQMVSKSKSGKAVSKCSCNYYCVTNTRL